MSIDDLFVLKRILLTPGVFAHYMEVRQAVAGMRRAFLFDEFDHLGAYITKNRFDQDIADQLNGGENNLVLWNGMSEVVDKSFEGEDWETTPMPAQEFPDEILKLLKALNTTRAPGWLSAESHLRNYNEQARKDLAKVLSDLGETIERHPARYFALDCDGDGQPLFVWIQNSEHDIEWEKITDKASAVALCAKSPGAVGLMVEVSAGCVYDKAQHFRVHVPSGRNEENEHIFDDAKRMYQRSLS